jgi:predicted nucleotidyltransferase component of viral defense system
MESHCSAHTSRSFLGREHLTVARNELLAKAGSLRFRPEMLEKVLQPVHLLNAICLHTFLASRVALKGGTALNLFLFDLPRLSVNFDFNYIHSADREAMEEERARVLRGDTSRCSREGYTITREPTDHAGGKFRFRYESELIDAGNLELDINFMLRFPLWPVETRDSLTVAGLQAAQVPVLEKHELAAAKLAALLARTATRDLIDAHRQANLVPGNDLSEYALVRHPMRDLRDLIVMCVFKRV